MTARMPTVLVVDDNADLRFVIRLGLERDDRFGAVREAGNGQEAIDVARECLPDVILLDQMMPVMTGMEALPVLRSIVPSARIVVFSAVAERLEGAGPVMPDAFVAKGCDLLELFDVLAEVPLAAVS